MKTDVGPHAGATRRRWPPAEDPHLHARPRLQSRAHVGVDPVIRELKCMGLQKPGYDQPRLCLTERCPDTGARASSKRHIGKGRSLASVGEPFGTELVCVLPDGWVTVCEVNGV